MITNLKSLFSKNKLMEFRTEGGGGEKCRYVYSIFFSLPGYYSFQIIGRVPYELAKICGYCNIILDSLFF